MSIPPGRIKDPGASGNPVGRFEATRHEADDGWWRDEEPAPAPCTKGPSSGRVQW